MNYLYNYLSKHFARLEKFEKKKFLWHSWLEVSLVAYLLFNVLQFLFPSGPRTDLTGLSPLHLIALPLILGPLVETLLFQCFSLEFSNSIRLRRGIRFGVSIVPFALMHHHSGLPTVLAAGGIGGFYFAFTYERWRRESLFAAIGMTFLLHSSFNTTAVIALILFSR